MLTAFLLFAGAAQVVVVPPMAASFEIAPVLRLLGEPPLEELGAERPVFRFVWMPPFPSMRIIAVRVQATPAGPALAAKAARWSFTMGQPPTGVVETVIQRPMTQGEWNALAELRVDGFWHFGPAEYPQPVFDGSDWVLEGAAWGERLRIVQHVPGPSPFKALCQAMFALFPLKLRENELALVH